MICHFYFAAGPATGRVSVSPTISEASKALAQLRSKINLAPKKTPRGPKPAPGQSGPFRVAAIWPHHEAPLVLTAVGGQQTVIATSFSPISFESILHLPVGRTSSQQGNAPSDVLPRWIFVMPYDAMNRSSKQSGTGGERVLAWEIFAGLIWGEGDKDPRYITTEHAENARFHLPWTSKLKSILAESKAYTPAPPRGIRLLPTTSDDTYLDTVRRIIDDIRRGKFYQINLLRFFQADQAHGWQNLCALMEKQNAPQATLVTQGSRVIASLSPERFIEITQDHQGARLTTWPIKGTAPRFADDPAQDENAGEALSHSEKDRAELRMIIDLMRNDLMQVCESGTVSVVKDGALKRFSHVWHLEGEVCGRLRPDATLETLLNALCPGGSITGAPKIAAMQRIMADEGQSRGYFMGHAFRINYDGSVQSNILIRTLVSDQWMKSARYAAGSGIVIKSDPQAELDEIRAKCAIVTEDQTPEPKNLNQKEAWK
jgi:para-aminobenzoate synthetase component 1